jgi:excisionase family DNA binding protein
MNDLPATMTVREVAETLRTTERSVLPWRQQDRLRAYKLGSFTRFRGDDVLAMLEAERRLNFGAAQQYQGERGVSFKTSRNPNIMHDANRVKPKLRFF